jgi:serine/threonine protein kinase
VAKRILRDLVDGMNHLRSHGVSHRDLKGDNIFLDCQGRFVIGDFGHCIIDETHARGNNFKVAEALGSFGTTEYNPPESFAVNAKTLVNPEKVDVFQLGTVLFSIFTGVCIWQINCGYFKRTDLDLDPRHNSTENKKFWDKWEEFRSRPSIIQHLGHASPISEEAKKLLNRMLSYDPEYRPTFSELLDAMYGRGDNSLQWLSGLKGTCSLEELYEELHERIADDKKSHDFLIRNSVGIAQLLS